MKENALPWCTVNPVDEDIMHWQSMLSGPEDTCYENGVFNLDIQFPSEYPFKPPKIKFLTKIYHPNVKTDTGDICADLLNENWGPECNVVYCLNVINEMLKNPNLDSPLEVEVAQLYTSDRKTFNSTAKKWTADYAQ